MLVLRRKGFSRYTYQEKDFGVLDWLGIGKPKYKTVDTGIAVSGAPKPPPLPTTPPSPSFGGTGPQTRAEKKDFRRQQELGSITTADKQKIMKENRLKSAKKLDQALQQEGSWQQRQALQQVRARNQEGITNPNVSKAAREKARLDLKTNEGVNVDAWSSLSDKAHNKEYMAQRRMERAQKVEQPNPTQQPKPQQPVQPKPQQPVQPKPTGGSSTIKLPNDLKNLPQQTPSIPSSPVLDSTITNNNSALTGLSSDLKNTTPQTSKTGGGSGSGSAGGGSSASTGATKTGAAAETASQAAAKKGVKFRTTAGRYALGGAATLGAGYLLYNHFKNKDKK